MIPKASMQQICQAFFDLCNQNKFEIGSLYNTIEACLAKITQTPGDFKYIMPTPDHFRDDSVISSIDELYCDAHFNEALIAKVLYIKWYYQMTLFAMGSFAAKKVVDYINKNSDIKVNVATSGSDFRFVLGNPAKFSIRNAAGGGPLDVEYSGFKLYSPIWEDILDCLEYNEDGEETLMKLEMTIAAEITSEAGAGTYCEDYVHLTDLGKLIKEHFIDKIKQIIASK